MTGKHIQVAEKLGGARPKSSGSSGGGGGSKGGGSGKEFAVNLNTQEFEEKVDFNLIAMRTIMCEIPDVNW